MLTNRQDADLPTAGPGQPRQPIAARRFYSAGHERVTARQELPTGRHLNVAMIRIPVPILGLIDVKAHRSEINLSHSNKSRAIR